MSLTIKRLANFYGVKKREQLVKLENERDEKQGLLRDEYLEELGLLNFYAETQWRIDTIRESYENLFAEAYEKGTIYNTSYQGFGYYLNTFKGENSIKKLDRHKVEFDTQEYRDRESLLNAPVVATEIEWDKLIGNIKARTTVKKALAYLHEIGIDTTEVEALYANKEVEPMLPATIINLNMLALKKEDEDK